LNNRRKFIVQLGLGSAAAVLASRAMADAAPLTEADPQASAMGFKLDGTKVDKTKFPKYAAGQQCSGCALYQGKAGDKSGPCSVFAGKIVPATGWCNVWAKKA